MSCSDGMAVRLVLFWICKMGQGRFVGAARQARRVQLGLGVVAIGLEI